MESYQPAPTPSFPPPPDPTSFLPSRLEPVHASSSSSRPVATTTPMPVLDGRKDIRSLRMTCEHSLHEYIALQNRQGFGVGGYDDDNDEQRRLRAQHSIVANELRALRKEISALAKKTEGRRWRRWILGGLLTSFIPIIRRLFRRSAASSSSSSSAAADLKASASTDTEYAFSYSKSLIARILRMVRRGLGSKVASLTLFLLAVLYVFTNEVTTRVARTLNRRLRKLAAKVEKGGFLPEESAAAGDGGGGGGVQRIGEEDLRVLKGWRWRVLLW